MNIIQLITHVTERIQAFFGCWLNLHEATHSFSITRGYDIPFSLSVLS